ncbi:ATP-binding protein [Streptomyces sp. NPDC058773]|uniref:ATP-binding protein n=1 Tax=Streptomyces sp. NPDC058773 TaxID=3346632 RepID=UPI003688D794
MTARADRRPLPGVVGRAVEHDLVSGLLQSAPLVTLTGAAGVGKSVLARAVLEEHTARHDGTVLRVGCWDGPAEGGLVAALLRAAQPGDGARRDSATALVRRTAGSRVGEPVPGAAGPPDVPTGPAPADDTAIAGLAAHCRRHRSTVLLDDCDPLRDECARLVRQLLRADPALRIVVTARGALGLPEERVVELAPLPVTLGEGTAGPAVELLAARAGAAAPELLAAVCQALEGSPLAIALAAQQLDRMSLPQLAAQVGADGPLYYSGPAATVRHTSLYAAQAAGYALCSPTDRRVWARLSVLPGDFDPWLAGCVCTSCDVPAAAVDGALERLVGASVLERVRDGGAHDDTGAALPPRYRLPRAARDFGRTQLREAGEESAALRRFRQACAALAAEAQIAWQGPDQQVAVRLVADERTNLDAALTRPPQDAEDALGALEIAVSLWFHWAACGHRREGRAHLDRLLLLSRDDTALRARALWLAGYLAAQEHAPGAAEALLDQAWTAAVMHADADGLARIAHAHGVLALRRGNSAAAVACLEEAAGHRSRDPWFGPGPAHSWALLALALSSLDAERAQAAARHAWENRHSDGDFWLYSTVLYACAATERVHGKPGAALEACRKALAAKKLIGDPLFIAGAREMVAGLRREVRSGEPLPDPPQEDPWWRPGGPGVPPHPFFSRLRAGP